MLLIDKLSDNCTLLCFVSKKFYEAAAEYSELKEEVNRIAFNLPEGKGKGTCIWEPLNMWESIFDKDENTNDHIKTYDLIKKEFLNPK